MATVLTLACLALGFVSLLPLGLPGFCFALGDSSVNFVRASGIDSSSALVSGGSGGSVAGIRHQGTRCQGTRHVAL